MFGNVASNLKRTEGGLVSRCSPSATEYQRFVRALGQQPLANFTASSSLTKSVHAYRIFLAMEFMNFASVQEWPRGDPVTGQSQQQVHKCVRETIRFKEQTRTKPHATRVPADGVCISSVSETQTTARSDLCPSNSPISHKTSRFQLFAHQGQTSTTSLPSLNHSA